MPLLLKVKTESKKEIDQLENRSVFLTTRQVNSERKAAKAALRVEKAGKMIEAAIED